MCTIWLALTDVDEQNGCLEIIPDGSDDVTQRETIRLQAGEMSLHKVDLLHASLPYSSGPPRVGFAVRYVAPTVNPPKPTSALLAIGESTFENYVLEQRPAADMDADARAAHRRAVENHPLRNKNDARKPAGQTDEEQLLKGA